VSQLAEVWPARLSPQRGDNRLVREGLSELHHPAQVLLTKRRSRGGLTLHPSATHQPAAMPMAAAMTEIVVNTKSTSFFNRSIDLPVPTSA
jgi:hypothetical protein